MAKEGSRASARSPTSTAQKKWRKTAEKTPYKEKWNHVTDTTDTYLLFKRLRTVIAFTPARIRRYTEYVSVVSVLPEVPDKEDTDEPNT